jgi:hypothetical protein
MQSRHVAFALVSVLALCLVVWVVTNDAPTIADTVSSNADPAPPPLVTIEQIDMEGNVVACYESRDVRKGPVGIIAFVTTDGRRLFLEAHQWRIVP